MVISQPPGNNPSYYYRASPTSFSNCLNEALLYRHLAFYMMATATRWVTHRNGAIKHIFYTNQIHGGLSADCSLFILFAHALALHLAVKILLQIFLYEDLSTLALHTSVGCILQNASRTPLCYATNTITKHSTFYINHQQNTRRSDQIETIKTHNATTRPSYHMEGFTNGSGCHF